MNKLLKSLSIALLLSAGLQAESRLDPFKAHLEGNDVVTKEEITSRKAFDAQGSETQNESITSEEYAKIEEIVARLETVGDQLDNLRVFYADACKCCSKEISERDFAVFLKLYVDAQDKEAFLKQFKVNAVTKSQNKN